MIKLYRLFAIFAVIALTLSSVKMSPQTERPKLDGPTPAQIFEMSYKVGNTLDIQARTEFLNHLVVAAADTKEAKDFEKWCEQLFFSAPPGDNKSKITALAMLSKVNSERAVKLINSTFFTNTVEIRDNEKHFPFGSSAQYIFLMYREKMKLKDIPKLIQAGDEIQKVETYPYAAMGIILNDQPSDVPISGKSKNPRLPAEYIGYIDTILSKALDHFKSTNDYAERRQFVKMLDYAEDFVTARPLYRQCFEELIRQLTAAPDQTQKGIFRIKGNDKFLLAQAYYILERYDEAWAAKIVKEYPELDRNNQAGTELLDSLVTGTDEGADRFELEFIKNQVMMGNYEASIASAERIHARRSYIIALGLIAEEFSDISFHRRDADKLVSQLKEMVYNKTDSGFELETRLAIARGSRKDGSEDYRYYMSLAEGLLGEVCKNSSARVCHETSCEAVRLKASQERIVVDSDGSLHFGSTAAFKNPEVRANLLVCAAEGRKTFESEWETEQARLRYKREHPYLND